MVIAHTPGDTTASPPSGVTNASVDSGIVIDTVVALPAERERTRVKPSNC